MNGYTPLTITDDADEEAGTYGQAQERGEDEIHGRRVGLWGSLGWWVWGWWK